MVGSQRVCKRHFQGYSKAQRMDFEEQGYRQYSHVVRVQVTTISCVKVRANAKIDFVSCLEQDGKRQDVICLFARVATIFLPRIETAWRDPSAASTGNTASALSASGVAPVIPVS